MVITDTHTHLYVEEFDEDRDSIIKAALAKGITRFFIPAIDATYTNQMLALEKAYPNNMFLMMGLHPTHVKENWEEELNHVSLMLATHRYYAVGEIGIDLYWDKELLAIQQHVFRAQIKLAKKHKLPIVIHCREAFEEVFEILEEERGEDLFGVLHCFSGDLVQANKAISYNMKLGIGGIVTFKNGKVDTFLNKIPIENIVLETDAPYLAPVPYRGKRNESGYISKVLEKVALLYNLSTAEVAAKTTENSKQVFGV